MKKLLSLLLCATMLISVAALTGCDTDDDKAPEQTTPALSDAADITTAAPDDTQEPDAEKSSDKFIQAGNDLANTLALIASGLAGGGDEPGSTEDLQKLLTDGATGGIKLNITELSVAAADISLKNYGIDQSFIASAEGMTVNGALTAGENRADYFLYIDKDCNVYINFPQANANQFLLLTDSSDSSTLSQYLDRLLTFDPSDITDGIVGGSFGDPTADAILGALAVNLFSEETVTITVLGNQYTDVTKITYDMSKLFDSFSGLNPFAGFESDDIDDMSKMKISLYTKDGKTLRAEYSDGELYGQTLILDIVSADSGISYEATFTETDSDSELTQTVTISGEQMTLLNKTKGSVNLAVSTTVGSAVVTQNIALDFTTVVSDGKTTTDYKLSTMGLSVPFSYIREDLADGTEKHTFSIDFSLVGQLTVKLSAELTLKPGAEGFVAPDASADAVNVNDAAQQEVVAAYVEKLLACNPWLVELFELMSGSVGIPGEANPSEN